MRVFFTIFAVVAMMLMLGIGGYFGWKEYEKRQAADAQYAATLGQLERLFADVYLPPDPPPSAALKLKDFGCQEAWLAPPRGANVRFAEAEKLTNNDSELINRLRTDDSPRGNYVRAMLVSHTAIKQRAELAGTDPEQLLRRAASKGHSHSMTYFARLRADLQPHWEDPKSVEDAANFFEINRQLEQAADAGSGGAAYLLGFRTQPEVIEKFVAIEPEGKRNIPRSSRSPQEWWCRAAQLGYASGQLQCYRVGGRRLQEAQELLTSAADAGHEVANATLAAAYGRGAGGFAKDPAKQKQFLCRAIALGHVPAMAALGRLEKQQAAENRRLEAQAKRAAKLKARSARVASPKLATNKLSKKPQLNAKKPSSVRSQRSKLAH